MRQKLYLMRHGQTLFNQLKRVQGACDSPLTDLGKQQAKQAKDYFTQGEINFAAAYSSTQERACDTMEIIRPDQVYTRKKGIKEWNYRSYIESKGQVVKEKTLRAEDTQQIVGWLKSRGLEFYLESNNGLFASENFASRSVKTIQEYIAYKGKPGAKQAISATVFSICYMANPFTARV